MDAGEFSSDHAAVTGSLLSIGSRTFDAQINCRVQFSSAFLRALAHLSQPEVAVEAGAQAGGPGSVPASLHDTHDACCCGSHKACRLTDISAPAGSSFVTVTAKGAPVSQPLTNLLRRLATGLEVGLTGDGPLKAHGGLMAEAHGSGMLTLAGSNWMTGLCQRDKPVTSAAPAWHRSLSTASGKIARVYRASSFPLSSSTMALRKRFAMFLYGYDHVDLRDRQPLAEIEVREVSRTPEYRPSMRQPMDIESNQRYLTSSCAHSGPGSHGMSNPPRGLEQMLQDIQKKAFRYFECEANPTNGWIRVKTAPDNTWSLDCPSSTDVVAFALAGNPVTVTRDFLFRESVVQRTLTTLRFFVRSAQGPEPDATDYQSFHYHFPDRQTGRRAGQRELTTIDTALLLAGMLSSARFFKGPDAVEVEIRSLTDSLTDAWSGNGSRTEIQPGAWDGVRKVDLSSSAG